ncbi:MAG TPA: serine hydrolase [Bryobacteraceae bacterium]
MNLFRLSAAALALSSALFAQSNLDDLAARALKEFNVPGIAVGVIQDGRVLVSKGYGVRKIGENAPVTEHTLFQIASNTKAFTAASLAILIDEKKLSWDDRVIDVLPSFQMSDAYVSREMRIRDLLCHRSGLALGAGDLMVFPDSTLSAPVFMQHLRFVPLAASFRSRYAYDNVLYTVAGQVIEKVSGMSWHDFIQQKIFAPLGMTESRPRPEDVQPQDEVAAPHAPNGDEPAVLSEAKTLIDQLQVVSPAHLGSGAPAGAINSSVHDLLKWVATQLHEGEYPGGRLFSAEQSQQMWTPHIFIPTGKSSLLHPIFNAYGLGWVLTEYHGHRLVYHTGGLAGMVTRVTLVPDSKLGIVVLTNQESGEAFNSLTYSLLDRYLNVAPTDWIAAYSALAKTQQNEAKKVVAQAAAARNARSKPSLAPEKYAGRYRDAWYGDILITQQAGKLAIEFTHSPKLVGTLEHFQYDTFIVRWNDRTLNADAYVTFTLNPNASIREVKMAAVSPATDFSFDFHDLDLKPAPPGTAPF